MVIFIKMYRVFKLCKGNGSFPHAGRTIGGMRNCKPWYNNNIGAQFLYALYNSLCILFCRTACCDQWGTALFYCVLPIGSFFIKGVSVSFNNVL